MDTFDADSFRAIMDDYDRAVELAKQRLAEFRRKQDLKRWRRQLAARLGEDPKAKRLRLASPLPRELIAKIISYDSDALDEKAWFHFCN